MASLKFRDGSGKKGKYIYHVVRTDEAGYDTFDEFVGCADSEDEVRKIHPDGALDENDVGFNWKSYEKHPRSNPWVPLSAIYDHLEVELIGIASNQTKGVILASYHAG